MPTSYTWPLDVPTGTTLDTPQTGDDLAQVARSIRLTEDGDLDITGGTWTFIAGLEAVRQAIRIRLLTVRGEWFLDASLGTPWLTEIFKKTPNIPALQSVFRSRILGTPGVKSVDRITLTFNRQARTLRVDFAATCDFGEFDPAVLTDSVEIGEAQ